MDEPARPRPGRAQHAGDRSRLCPLPVGDERCPRAGQQSPERPQRPQIRQATARQFIEAVRHALYASKICSYAQGFVQLQAAAKEYNWPLNYGDFALLWRGGCIIRRRLPRPDQGSVRRRPEARKPAARTLLHQSTSKAQDAWRHVVVARHADSAFRSPDSPPPWPTTTATAATACRPTCCKPSAITSALTPTSASTSPARSTPIRSANALRGCGDSPTASGSMRHRTVSVRISCNNLFGLDGQVAVVIGGTGVLGGALCDGLAQAGASVVVAGRSEERGRSVSTQSKPLGGKATFLPVDAPTASQFKPCSTATIKPPTATCDVLVNCAGVNSPSPTERSPTKNWDQVVNGNLLATHLGCQIFGQHMADAGGRLDPQHRQRHRRTCRCRESSPTRPRRRPSST